MGGVGGCGNECVCEAGESSLCEGDVLSICLSVGLLRPVIVYKYQKTDKAGVLVVEKGLLVANPQHYPQPLSPPSLFFFFRIKSYVIQT